MWDVNAGGGRRPPPANCVPPKVLLVGHSTRPFHVRPTGTVDLLGVRLEAHGATWLGVELPALVDEFVELRDPEWPELAGLVSKAADGTASRFALVSGVLARLISSGRAPDPRVVSAVANMRAVQGLVDVTALAPELGTTPRTLQRLFARDVGITPRLLSRIIRFQRVFSAWRAEPPARSLPEQPALTRFFRV